MHMKIRASHLRSITVGAIALEARAKISTLLAVRVTTDIGRTAMAFPGDEHDNGIADLNDHIGFLSQILSKGICHEGLSQLCDVL